MGQVYLKPGKEKRVFLGHPWIFLSDIDRADRSVSPGDTVTVCTKQGKFLAKAVYNPKSQIALRILSIYDEAIDEALKKLDEAGIDRFLEEYQKQLEQLDNAHAVG